MEVVIEKHMFVTKIKHPDVFHGIQTNTAVHYVFCETLKCVFDASRNTNMCFEACVSEFYSADLCALSFQPSIWQGP